VERVMSTEKQLSMGQRISGFFRQVGLPEPMKTELFWKKLEKRHGGLARDFSRAVEEREHGENSVNPYGLKNTNELFSLDVTGQYESKLYRDFVEWLVGEHFDDPKAILDVGCGNGVLTCLIAHLWPTATVVGYDGNDGGLEIARSIATRLGLSNIEFRHADFGKLTDLLAGQTFDLVVAVKALHEMLTLPEISALCGHTVKDLEWTVLPPENTDGLRQIGACLSSNGRLISIDRWSDSAPYIWWIRSAEAAGMRLSLDKSFILATSEAGSPHEFPISVFSGNDNLPPPTNEQLLAFFAFRQLNKHIDKIGEMTGPVAEAFYLSFGRREVIASLEATYRDGSGTLKTELFIAGAFSGLYSTWSSGSRSLFLAPAVAIGSMLQHFLKSAADLDQFCDVAQEDHDCGKTLQQFGLPLIES
jgi:SAM-dependent methyltransferase